MTAGVQEPDVVVRCSSLADRIDFLVERAGLRLDAIWPADDPRHALLSLEGLTVELRLDGAPPRSTGRGGQSDDGRDVILTHLDREAGWVVGRAGMRYRDLIPDRMGGRYIASHIEIPDGGPVPDYVHFHDVGFQVIVCAAGWVRVVYEDQGPPFLLHPGDCVLQAQGIRHRVLEASPGLEVVEISAPAEHVTHVEHDITLPTGFLRPDRDFGGQRFVRHVHAEAPVASWRGGPLRCRDTGIAAATRGAGQVVTIDAVGAGGPSPWSVGDADLLLLYVLGGAAAFEVEGSAEVAMRRGSAAVVPPGRRFRLASWTDDVALLEVVVVTPA
jgi:quercetin dioxygenase-like cupin family protein